MNLPTVRSAGHRGFAVAIALLLPGAAALAQETTPAPVATTAKESEIIVTGTRLPEPNLISTSPIQAVTAEDIKISGRSDMSDVLLLMPQNFNNSLGQDLGNRTSGLTTAGGVATADLRGLGPNRTLVLVNGRRLGVGSPNTAIQSPAPDLDQIPAGLVERVDVVTGGASAVYGSDAIAGVVNFIMKKNFEGLEVTGNYGFNWDDNNNTYMQQQLRDFPDASGASETPLTGSTTDGQNGNVTIIAGSNTADGRGNVTAYLGYYATNPVASAQRDWGQCQLNKDTRDDGSPTGFAFCSGSSNSNWFQPRSFDNGDVDANGDPIAVYSVLGTDFIQRGTAITTPPAAFNSQKNIFMSRQDERYNAGLTGHYDVNDYVKPYVEFAFTNDKTHQEIAPSGLFRSSNVLTDDGHYLINCSNPLLSDQQQHVICSQADIDADLASPGSALATVEIGRRNIEGGGRSSDYEHTNYRAVAGATGDFATAWNYDFYTQYFYTQFYNTNNQYLNLDSITNALQVTTDPDTGDPVCISGGSCVPWNIFSDGGVTQDQLAYLYTNGTAYGTTQLGTIHVDVTGKLGEYGIKLPTASDGLSINVGYERRREHTQFAPDAAEQSGLLSGFGGAQNPVDKSVTVDEEFVEMRVPLIQEKTGIYDLSFDGGYRHSDYSTAGGADTYKFEVQYAPVAGARLRGSYQRAIRAPSIIELFNPQLVGQIQAGNDPCAPFFDDDGVLHPATATLAQCLNTVSPADAAAFTAAYGNGFNTSTIPNGTAGQLTQLQGGFDGLTPEEADTYSVGVTFTPDLLPHFTGSIDYFLIKLDKAIGVIPASAILNGCPATGDAVFCNELSRHPLNFGLVGASVESGGYIKQLNRNIGGAQVSGIDVQAAYQLEMSPGAGSLKFELAGSYMIENKSTPYEGAHTYDCAGLFGFTCQTVNPEWHHNFRVTWQSPWDLTAALTWRFIDAVKQDNNDSDPTLHFASYNGFDYLNKEIASHSYFDLAATYHPFTQLELRAGINNIADNHPPVITTEIISGGQANTYETYDMFGRQVFMGFTLKL